MYKSLRGEKKQQSNIRCIDVENDKIHAPGSFEVNIYIYINTVYIRNFRHFLRHLYRTTTPNASSLPPTPPQNISDNTYTLYVPNIAHPHTQCKATHTHYKNTIPLPQLNTRRRIVPIQHASHSRIFSLQYSSYTRDI